MSFQVSIVPAYSMAGPVGPTLQQDEVPINRVLLSLSDSIPKVSALAINRISVLIMPRADKIFRFFERTAYFSFYKRESNKLIACEDS